jgi:hypothetical protein
LSQYKYVRSVDDGIRDRKYLVAIEDAVPASLGSISTQPHRLAHSLGRHGFASRKKGNVWDEDGDVTQRSYIEIFEALRKNPTYVKFRSQVNDLILTNSNIDHVDILRTARAEGSDIERSNWKFYTPLQNLMYKTLYPEQCVDLAWTSHLEPEEALFSLRHFIIEHIMRPWEKNKERRHEINKLAVRANTLGKVRVPHAPLDLTELNMKTHVYVGRAFVATIDVDDDDDDEGGEKGIKKIKCYMDAHIPRCVSFSL